jgi:hypothetical protein
MRLVQEVTATEKSDGAIAKSDGYLRGEKAVLDNPFSSLSFVTSFRHFFGSRHFSKVMKHS